ncbi:unnamed protein product [Prorocentrum cordatum]|uniref:Uncharacterized protein n=1 Tax=Prorocentrum cordatum TaxID=2364126 RepID=A0ABN9Y9I6_9DINO|nr:unnamed protein product [Polarella glacialis]
MDSPGGAISRRPLFVAVVLFPEFELLDVAAPGELLGADGGHFRLAYCAEHPETPVRSSCMQLRNSERHRGSELGRDAQVGPRRWAGQGREGAAREPGSSGRRSARGGGCEGARRAGPRRGPGAGRQGRAAGGGQRVPEGVAEDPSSGPLLPPRALVRCVTVCTGSWLLGAAGALDGRRATSNKSALAAGRPQAAAPAVQWVLRARWVEHIEREAGRHRGEALPHLERRVRRGRRGARSDRLRLRERGPRRGHREGRRVDVAQGPGERPVCARRVVVFSVACARAAGLWERQGCSRRASVFHLLGFLALVLQLPLPVPPALPLPCPSIFPSRSSAPCQQRMAIPQPQCARMQAVVAQGAVRRPLLAPARGTPARTRSILLPPPPPSRCLPPLVVVILLHCLPAMGVDTLCPGTVPPAPPRTQSVWGHTAESYLGSSTYSVWAPPHT